MSITSRTLWYAWALLELVAPIGGRCAKLPVVQTGSFVQRPPISGLEATWIEAGISRRGHLRSVVCGCAATLCALNPSATKPIVLLLMVNTVCVNAPKRMLSEALGRRRVRLKEVKQTTTSTPNP